MSDMGNDEQARMLLEQHEFSLSLLEARYLNFILDGALARVEFKDATSKELEQMIKYLQHRLHEFVDEYSPNISRSTSSSTRGKEGYTKSKF
jgi:hypothetical protein